MTSNRKYNNTLLLGSDALAGGVMMTSCGGWEWRGSGGQGAGAGGHDGVIHGRALQGQAEWWTGDRKHRAWLK